MEFVINLFCNGRHRIHPNFIRFQTLSYIARKGGCRRDRLVADYLTVCPPVPNLVTEVEILHCLEHSLLRLLNCRLISSPDHLMLEQDTDVAELSEIDVTGSGRYYLHELCKYVEYVSFMKDSVDFEAMPDFRSCVEATRTADRCKDVLAFLRYLVGREEVFLKGVPLKHRTDYLDNFSYDGKTAFFMKRIIAFVAQYVKRRVYRAAYYSTFERGKDGLLAEIDAVSDKWRSDQR